MSCEYVRFEHMELYYIWITKLIHKMKKNVNQKCLLPCSYKVLWNLRSKIHQILQPCITKIYTALITLDAYCEVSLHYLNTNTVNVWLIFIFIEIHVTLNIFLQYVAKTLTALWQNQLVTWYTHGACWFHPTELIGSVPCSELT